MKLIEEWRQFWRWSSVHLAMAAGLLAGYFAQYPAQWQSLLDYIPEQYRAAASFVIGAFVFAVPTLARVTQQGGKPNA